MATVLAEILPRNKLLFYCLQLFSYIYIQICTYIHPPCPVVLTATDKTLKVER